MEGRGEGGLINFPPLKKGAAYLRGGLNGGFTVRLTLLYGNAHR